MRPLPEIPEQRPAHSRFALFALAAAGCLAASNYAWDAYATTKQSAQDARAVLARSLDQQERAGAIVVLLRDVRQSVDALRAAAAGCDAAAKQAAAAIQQIQEQSR